MVFTFKDYGFPFLWGLIMLASWIGWGQLLRAGLGFRRAHADWGLLAGWGMSVTLAIAGFLQLARLANRTFLVSLLLLGALIWAIMLARRLSAPVMHRRILATLSPRRLLPLLPLILLLAFRYASSIQTHDINLWDDLPAYLVMIKRLLQTGIILNPYGVRRLLTFGGQQILDAQLVGATSFFNIDILEKGLARIIFAGLLWGAMAQGIRGRRWLKAIPLFLLLLIPVPHVNTNSQLTGSILFLTLLRTFTLRLPVAHEWRRVLPIAIVAAAFASMRMNYVPTVGLAMALAYGARLLWPRIARRTTLLHAAAAFALFALLLLPWSIVLFQSSHSFLYPLFRGTQRPNYDYLHANLTPVQTVVWILRFLGVPGIPPLATSPNYIQEPFWGVPALLLPLVLAFTRRLRRVELPFYLAALAATLMTLFAYTLTEYENLYRFTFPALLAVAAPVLLRAILSPRWSIRSAVAGALFCFLIGVNLLRPLYSPAGLYNSDSFFATFDERWNVWRDARYSLLFASNAPVADYQSAQDAIPPHQPIFVAASFPALLNYARNPIFTIDMVGGASPDPGMPLLAGPAAVKNYLKNQGIHYLIFNSPDTDLAHLKRSFWMIVSQDSAASPADIRVQKFNNAAIRDLDSLGKTEKVLYTDGSLTALRLR